MVYYEYGPLNFHLQSRKFAMYIDKSKCMYIHKRVEYCTYSTWQERISQKVE